MATLIKSTLKDNNFIFENEQFDFVINEILNEHKNIWVSVHFWLSTFDDFVTCYKEINTSLQSHILIFYAAIITCQDKLSKAAIQELVHYTLKDLRNCTNPNNDFITKFYPKNKKTSAPTHRLYLSIFFSTFAVLALKLVLK